MSENPLVSRTRHQPPRELPLRDEVRSRLGTNLIRSRIAADLTQRELAAAIGVSWRCIQSGETDRAWPSIHKFALAAETLGMTMDALWSGSGREASDG